MAGGRLRQGGRYGRGSWLRNSGGRQGQPGRLCGALVLLVVILISAPLTALAGEGSGQRGPATALLRVPAALPGSPLLRALAARGADLLSSGPRGAVLAATAEERQWLEARGERFTVLREDLSAFRTDATRQVEDSAFHTYEELVAELQGLAAAYPGIASLQRLGGSHEGRDVWGLQISDHAGTDEPEEPRVLLVGCHHAREWISVEVPLLIAEHLLAGYGADPRVTAIVEGAEIWIVPLLNPDGHVFTVEHDRLWRKNRRDNGDGSRGVDLNRNYSYQWGYDDEGSSPWGGNETYRGPAPFSEPEAQAVRDLFQGGRPFSAAITYHNFSQVVLTPWGYVDEPTPDESYYVWLAENMASLITAVYGVPYVGGRGADLLYLTNGDFDDWVYGTFRIPSFTIEMRPGPDSGYEGFLTPPQDIQPIFQENLPAAFWLIERAVQGLPLDGDIDLTARVDGMDLGYLSHAFGSGAGGERWDPQSDLDGNGVIDGADLALLAWTFGIVGWGVNPF